MQSSTSHLEAEVSDAARAIIASIRAAQAQDDRALIPTRDAMKMLGCSERRLFDLIGSNELLSILEGGSRRIVAASLYDLVCRRAIASHPADGPAARIHDGSSRLRKVKARPPRTRTANELEALKRANAERAEEARRRKAAKAAAQASRAP
jgi:hypothetical protein